MEDEIWMMTLALLFLFFVFQIPFIAGIIATGRRAQEYPRT